MRTPAPPAHAAADHGGSARGERYWPALGLLAILLLLWTSRGAPFGVPAADDYDYLYWLAFRPFDLFDSMGALYYWRPVGRQLYYLLLEPVIFVAPWVVALVHALLLAVTFTAVYRVARRVLSPPAAAAAGVFPILAEPVRTLFVWPTGGEYLLAMAASAVAVDQTLSGRRWIAGAAALVALLSHEVACLVLPAIPLLAWARTRDRRETWRWAAVAGLVAGLWLVGHVVAHARGTGWLAAAETAGGSRPWLPASYLTVLGRTLLAQMNLEELYGPARIAVALTFVALVLLAVFYAARTPAAGARLRAASPWLLGGAAWFLVGAAPLALLYPEWTAWRTPFPALWLGLALVGALWLVRPWLAGAFVILRVAALALAPTASTVVSQELPNSSSTMSFVRVARLQRTAEVTRSALLERFPTLPPGAAVAYWSRVPVTEIATAGPKGVRVWYADSTITWEWLWRPGGQGTRYHAVLGFDPGQPRPAVVLEPTVVELSRAAVLEMDRGRLRDSDSLFVLALRRQSARPCYQLAYWAAVNRARIAYGTGRFALADTLNRAGFELAGESAEYHGMAALLALERGDASAAAREAALCLRLDPHHPYGRHAAARLDSIGRVAGGQTAPRSGGNPGLR